MTALRSPHVMDCRRSVRKQRTAAWKSWMVLLCMGKVRDFNMHEQYPRMAVLKGMLLSIGIGNEWQRVGLWRGRQCVMAVDT